MRLGTAAVNDNSTITHTDGAHTRTISESYIGGSGGHSHTFTGTASTISTLQPYVTCYMWKRTA